jgi:hypothetical protein
MTAPMHHDGMRPLLLEMAMLREVWKTFVRNHIVARVPDEMSACLDCGAVQCINGQYATCPSRLAEVAVLKATRMTEHT